MKQAQMIGIAIATGAGLLAFVAMKMAIKPPPPKIVEAVPVDAAQVLVAKSNLSLGDVTNEGSFRWQDWPRDAVNPSFVTKQAKPEALKDLSGAIARSTMLAGEPITESKLIKVGSGGVLSAILPQGMRAISTKISEQTAVGKMILPNDHVDVILTQRKRGRGGNEEHVTDTLFRNVKVLAIGQQVEAKDGKKSAEGSVATLQLTPKQTELLALANVMGEISLALRSIEDLKGDSVVSDDGSKKEQRGNAIRVLRYGVKSRAYGVN
jgi:pilus assembly protein CpaB